jgi:hypothetical protein
MALVPLTWPRPADDIDSFQSYLGVNYRLRGGKIYTWPANVEQATFYDINFITNNYKTEAGLNYKTISGTDYPCFTKLDDTFVGATIGDITTMVANGKNWNSMSLLSPLAPTIAQYVALKQGIIAGTRDFLDNRIDILEDRTSKAPTTDPAVKMPNAKLERLNFNYRGPSSFFKPSQILKFLCKGVVAPLTVTKTSLDNEVMFFAKGDTVRISIAIFIESGTPAGIHDLECDYATDSPGLRILLDNLVPRVELKWLDKPTYYQNGAPVALQRGRWHKIDTEYVLTDLTDGTVKMWLDDVLIIDRVGQTLATPDLVLTRLEIGIPANDQATDCVVYIGHLKIR